jgi:hypothetical protein
MGGSASAMRLAEKSVWQVTRQAAALFHDRRLLCLFVELCLLDDQRGSLGQGRKEPLLTSTEGVGMGETHVKDAKDLTPDLDREEQEGADPLRLDDVQRLSPFTCTAGIGERILHDDRLAAGGRLPDDPFPPVEG